MSGQRDVDFGHAVALLIDQERRSQGWSLERLAEEADLHRTSVGLIVRRRRRMTLDVAARLCWALGLTVTDVCANAERSLNAGPSGD